MTDMMERIIAMVQLMSVCRFSRFVSSLIRSIRSCRSRYSRAALAASVSRSFIFSPPCSLSHFVVRLQNTPQNKIRQVRFIIFMPICDIRLNWWKNTV
nr:MAG TPA: hypothetical protein [Caudoviricetes sp.]